MLRDFGSIVFWVFLGGAVVWGYGAATDKKAEKSTTSTKNISERRASVEAIVKAGPTTKTWPTPEGQIIEISIPSVGAAGLFADIKQCIVWQSKMGTQAAMSCDPAAEPQLLPDEPDNSPPYRF